MRSMLCRLTLAAAVVFAGCNPFQTGAPEKPVEQHFIYPQPTTTDNILAIMALALGAKDSRAYLERLSAEFVFRPDPVQMQGDDFRNFPTTWTRDHEEVFLAALFSNTDSIAVVWSDVLSQTRSDGAQVTASYDLTIRRSGQADAHYSGRAEFFMVQVAGVWNVRTWDDVVTGGVGATWGLLRAQFLATG